jgi:chorismate mutase/prephenate dehydratase
MTDVPAPDLAALRNRIDAIDQELVRLLAERARLAQDIGKTKAAVRSAVFVPHREQDVFRRITEANPGPLPDAALRAIWREIMSASLALEHPLRICHFGQPGAFTHLAATLKFGQSVQYAGVDSIATVFGEVERGHADYGVAPIENSTDGAITDTIDAFLATDLRIINEIHLRIRHHLMARCARDQIQRIYSRNTVFAQCRQWLAANMPGVELVEVVNTTKAAERAAAEEGAASIGPQDAATRYELPILASDIQDNPNNITRFVVVAKPERAAQRTGDDKTSVMFGVQDRPGALYDCLLPFHHAGINLCRIESRPSRRRPWEYLFFIDLSGHQTDGTIRHALAELGKHTSMLEVLGSYPRAESPLNE